MRGDSMLVIVGLNVLLFAGVIAFVGVLSNAGVAHPLCGCVAVAHFTSNANATLNWRSCLSPARPAARNCWPATLSARRRHRHGEPDPMRYRFFPARLGSICCEPFEGETGSDKTNVVTSATARQHHSKAAATSRP
jgi:hypothetical protein